jgi:regulator of protease activity HflC (stomatin/prohibitin superfamily)
VTTFFLLVLFFSGFYTVKSTERGVLSTFGKVEETIIEPGLHAKIPFVQHIDKYTIVPQEYKLIVECVGQAAALSKDNQSLGYTAVVNYQYNESEIINIAKNWSRDRLIDNMKNEFIFATKSAVAQFSSSDIASSQIALTKSINEICASYFSDKKVPINIVNVTIDSWDWTDDFDQQIKATMTKQQEVKQKEAEVEIATQEAQKIVVQSQAKKEAAQNDADATKIAADAEAYKNKVIAQNMMTMSAQWSHDEKMKELDKWDGVMPGSKATIITPNYTTVPITQTK